MRFAFSIALVIGFVSIAALAEDQPARVEHSKPLPPHGESLGTKAYEPTPAEKAASKDWKEAELNSGSMGSETLQGPIGRRVAWFGIVRDVAEDDEKHETRLLVEMKFFDGLTDIHQQIVSIFGLGDFRATIPGTGHKIKKLALVRVLGKVTGEEKGLPVVSAEFVRCWDWGLFAFMDYGTDKSNAEWVKLRTVDPNDSYSSDPGPMYYEKLLGKR